MRAYQLATAFAAGIAAAAAADVTPIGAFTGDATETFEAVAPPGGYSGPMSIFEGAATMRDTLANTCVIAFSWQGAGPDQLLPFNGNLMGGTVAGSTLFTFDPPVSSFGGYMSTVFAAPGGSAIFRDASGNEIATLDYPVVPFAWTWIGWTSTTPLGSVELIGAGVPGFGGQFDDLQIAYGAECPADLSGSSDPNDPNYGSPDGTVDAADFFYFLDQFSAGNLAVADLTGSADPNSPSYGVPDGTLDASDFFFYLDLFVAGCP